MEQVLEALDALLDRLDRRKSNPLEKRSVPRDAIDEIMSQAPRRTSVQPLREHETIVQFRREVTDGLIRADTIHQLLGLIRLAIERVRP